MGDHHSKLLLDTHYLFFISFVVYLVNVGLEFYPDGKIEA